MRHIILYEAAGAPARTVFTDGRPLPIDPNPAWFGYSIGRWDGDTLLISTAGFNDRGWLDTGGHPQTGSLRLTERLHRRDFGHVDLEMILDDQKVFAAPVSLKTELLANPDTQLLEDVCENEQDRKHFVTSAPVRLSEVVLSRYAGTYDLGGGREVIVEAKDSSVIVRGINEAPIPLLPQSETQFVSSLTSNGFEFVVDTSGTVTQLVIRGTNGETRASKR